MRILRQLGIVLRSGVKRGHAGVAGADRCRCRGVEAAHLFECREKCCGLAGVLTSCVELTGLDVRSREGDDESVYLTYVLRRGFSIKYTLVTTS